MYPIARGQRSWAAAVADGSVELFGEPTLVHALPTWFRATGRSESHTSDMAVV
jgi:hypothetical protein